MSAHAFTRRRLMAGAGGALLLSRGRRLLQWLKLQQDSTGPTPARSNEAVKLPTYIPYTGVKPDLPGTEQGVDPAFRNFPKDRPKSVPEVTGQRGDVDGDGEHLLRGATGPGPEQLLAGLNKRMSVDLKLQMVGNADYTQKFATTIAGNELPDMMTPHGSSRHRTSRQLLDKRFTNLSEHRRVTPSRSTRISANIPTRTWKSAIFNGGIYGIPIPRGAIGSTTTSSGRTCSRRPGCRRSPRATTSSSRPARP